MVEIGQLVSELLWGKEKAGSGRQYDCISLLSLGKPSSSMHYSQGHCCRPKRANKNYKTVRVRIMFIFPMAELKARGHPSSALPASLGSSESISQGISLPAMRRGYSHFNHLWTTAITLFKWKCHIVASCEMQCEDKSEDEELQNPSINMTWPWTMIWSVLIYDIFSSSI